MNWNNTVLIMASIYFSNRVTMALHFFIMHYYTNAYGTHCYQLYDNNIIYCFSFKTDAMTMQQLVQDLLLYVIINVISDFMYITQTHITASAIRMLSLYSAYSIKDIYKVTTVK